MSIPRHSGQGHPFRSLSKVDTSTKRLCLTTMMMNELNLSPHMICFVSNYHWFLTWPTIDVPDLVPHLKLRPIVEWSMVVSETKHRHPKDTCWKEIGYTLLNIVTILGTIANIIWNGGRAKWSFDNLEDLHFDNAQDVHARSKNREKRGLQAQLRCANHLVLFECFISYEKWCWEMSVRDPLILCEAKENLHSNESSIW